MLYNETEALASCYTLLLWSLLVLRGCNTASVCTSAEISEMPHLQKSVKCTFKNLLAKMLKMRHPQKVCTVPVDSIAT